MDISVTEFKAHCLDLIRSVEKSGQPVTIKRHGKVVARLTPPLVGGAAAAPWERLRHIGKLLASPEESVLQADDFEANR